MVFTTSTALQWAGAIIGIAVILQTLEHLALRKAASEQGIWRWSVVKRDFQAFSPPLRWIFDRLLGTRGFYLVLIIRLLAACAILLDPHPILMGYLFISTLLIAMRWRGTFNGGSDCMTLIVLLALGLGISFQHVPGVARGCLWYIAIQACASYFIAGLVKLKSSDWRRGRALVVFLDAACYKPPPGLRRLLQPGSFSRAASWAIILFECSFPLVFFNPWLCIVFMGLGMLFHIGNVFLFGLNRFVWAWAAAYPALYLASLSVSQGMC